MAENGLRIRMDDGLRTDFIQTCRGNDQTAAQVLRAFMRQYIEAGKSAVLQQQTVSQAAHSQQKQ